MISFSFGAIILNDMISHERYDDCEQSIPKSESVSRLSLTIFDLAYSNNVMGCVYSRSMKYLGRYRISMVGGLEEL